MHIPQNELLLYKLFLSHPERSFYMQEIGRILKKSAVSLFVLKWESSFPLNKNKNMIR